MRIIIEGAGQVGSHLAKLLSQDGADITVIDDDAQRLSILSSTADVVTMEGDLSSIELLNKAGCGKADLFIAVNPFKSQSVNILSAQIAKRLGSRQVIARIDDEQYLTNENKLMFKEMGIDLLLYPEKIASDEIVDMLKHTASTDSMDFASGKLRLSVFKLDDDSPLLDMNVADFSTAFAEKCPGEKMRVVAIARDGKTLIPKFDTKFKYNDLVYIIATKDGMAGIMRFLGKDDVRIRRVMILGGSEIGQMTAARLAKMDLDSLKIIEVNKSKARQLSEDLPDEVDVVSGDIRNSDFLVEEGLQEYDAVVAVAGNDETNILACVVAKRFGVPRVIAQVENLEYVRLAEEMGVDTVINKKLITASRTYRFTLSDKVRFVRYMSGTDAEVMEYTVSENSRITRDSLKNLDFPVDAIIGGVIRGADAFIAVGDTRIEPFDRVAVFAKPSAIKDVDKFFK